MCSSACASSLTLCSLISLFAPRLAHQKSLTMNENQSLQNVVSIQHLVVTHGVTHCRFKAVLPKCLKQYTVCIHTLTPARKVCTYMDAAVSCITKSGCWSFYAEITYKLRACTDLKQDENTRARTLNTNNYVFMTIHQHSSQICLPWNLWTILLMLFISILPNSCNGTCANMYCNMRIAPTRTTLTLTWKRFALLVPPSIARTQTCLFAPQLLHENLDPCTPTLSLTYLNN